MTDTHQPQSPTKRTWAWALVPVLAFAAIASVFAYALHSGDPSSIPSALIGKSPPATSFAPLEHLKRDGAQVPGFSASDLVPKIEDAPGGMKPKTVILNFWASWCGPCILEHPQIEALSKREDVDVYGVNYKDENSNARRYLNKYGNPYKALGVDQNGRGAIEWGVTKMPETFLISPSGKIVYKFSGPISANDLKNKIVPVIESANRSKNN